MFIEVIKAILADLVTFLDATKLVVPSMQMVSYLLILNFLMLFGLYRYCFMASLSFAFYWLFIVNQNIFIKADGAMYGGHMTFIAIGVCFLFLIGGSFSNAAKGEK